MQNAKKPSPRKTRNGHIKTRNGIPRYRRVIPLALRPMFGGKSEFIRSLNTLSKAEAEAEYELLCAGGAPAPNHGSVQPVAPPQWPPAPDDIDEGYLRALAGTGGAPFHTHVAHLEGWARETRARIALGIITDPEHVAALEAHAATYERLSRQARGEKPAPKVTVKDAADRFLATITVEGTLSQYRPRLGDLVEALGAHKDIRAVTPQQVRTYAESVHTIPSNRRKKWPGLTLAKAITRGEAEGADLISVGTQRGHVTLAKNFFQWAEDTGLIDASPATNIPRPKGELGTRDDFSPDQLKVLFQNAPYTGETAPDARQNQPGFFWVFPIALFSGMRRGEPVLLRKQDVKHERGVWFIDLKKDHGAGRGVKTKTSVRRVPIHPTLIAMGFLDYVASLPQGAWLFPDLMRAKSPGDAYGKRWAEHLKRLGLKKSGLCFHSLRHTFETAGRECAIDPRYTDKIGGWKTPGVSEKYGKYPLAALAREIAKLSFEVDLTHLHLNPIARSEGEKVQQVATP